jgi:N-acetylglutamate synthase
MADRPRSALGPHCVGMRVVVRRVLRGRTGPSGGPLMSDVLGVMESWSDAATVLRTERGETVVVAVPDIVSGKPVPPRPATRRRTG